MSGGDIVAIVRVVGKTPGGDEMIDKYEWHTVDAEHPLTEADQWCLVEASNEKIFEVDVDCWTTGGCHKVNANKRIVRILRPVTDPDGEWCAVDAANPLTPEDAGPRVRVRGKDWEFIGPAIWAHDTYPFVIHDTAWTTEGEFLIGGEEAMDMTHIWRPKPTSPTWNRGAK